MSTYDVQRKISLSIDHLQLLSRGIACQHLDDTSFPICPGIFGHPEGQRCQSARSLVATFKHHFLQLSFVEEVEDFPKLLGVVLGVMIALVNQEAMGHVSPRSVS